MKQALIVTNLAGFLCFLWDDIEILKSSGYEVSVATNGKLMDGSEAIELSMLRQRKIPFFQVDFDSKTPFSCDNLKSYNQMKDIMRKKKYDLIHCHTPIAGLIARICAKSYRKKGTKVIYTSHGFAFTSQASKKEWMLYYNCEKMMSRFSDAIITINKEDFANAKKMNCKKVYYIHGMGVNIERFAKCECDRSEYRKKIGVNDDAVMILSVGELSERKNHQIVIRALGKIEDKEKYIYVICGRAIVSSNMKEKLEELAEKVGVNLILLGHRKDIPEINKCADIAVIPSVREGLGFAGIEALASGLPVIGTNVQGIRDYIETGKNGFLCSAFDEVGFAEKIKECANMDENKKRDMKQYARKSSMQFDLSVSHAERIKIYEEILGM